MMRPPHIRLICSHCFQSPRGTFGCLCQLVYEIFGSILHRRACDLSMFMANNRCTECALGVSGEIGCLVVAHR